MTLATVGKDNILHGMFYAHYFSAIVIFWLISFQARKRCSSHFHTSYPILLAFTLLFAVCISMCGVAYALIAMRSSSSMIVNDSDGLCSRWMKSFVASDEFTGIRVLGYVVVVAFVVGRALDLVLGFVDDSMWDGRKVLR